MPIESINPIQQNIREVSGRGTETRQPTTVSFGDTIRDFIESVKDAQSVAEQRVEEVIQGRSENLLAAMTALEESSLSFQLMLEIRNKLLEAYQEISRTQI
jgi:flagellar hook-basal body complex protein FliE